MTEHTTDAAGDETGREDLTATAAGDDGRASAQGAGSGSASAPAEPVVGTADVPVPDDAPVAQIVPVLDDAPVAEIVPVLDDAPVAEIAPVLDDAPVADPAPVPVNVPVLDDAPAPDAPVLDDAPGLAEAAAYSPSLDRPVTDEPEQRTQALQDQGYAAPTVDTPAEPEVTSTPGEAPAAAQVPDAPVADGPEEPAPVPDASDAWGPVPAAPDETVQALQDQGFHAPPTDADASAPAEPTAGDPEGREVPAQVQDDVVVADDVAAMPLSPTSPLADAAGLTPALPTTGDTLPEAAGVTSAATAGSAGAEPGPPATGDAAAEAGAPADDAADGESAGPTDDATALVEEAAEALDRAVSALDEAAGDLDEAVRDLDEATSALEGGAGSPGDTSATDAPRVPAEAAPTPDAAPAAPAEADATPDVAPAAQADATPDTVTSDGAVSVPDTATDAIPADAASPDAATPDTATSDTATSDTATPEQPSDSTTPTATPAPTPPAPGPSGTGPRPVPRPVPRPMPRAPQAPVAPAAGAPTPPVAPPQDAAEAAHAATFGRVDEEGTVYVREAAGERAVGQFPGATADEALALYVRRFLDLHAKVVLFETRLASADLPPKEIEQTLGKLGDELTDPAAVGDLDGLRSRLDALRIVAADRRAAAEAERVAAKQAAVAARTAIVEQAEKIAATDPERIQWRPAGEQLRQLLDQWKDAQRNGPRIDRPTEEALWKRFSHARTTFDRERRHFFAELEARNASARSAKEQLVAQAERLSTSTDWGATAGAYRDLMAQWKASGRASRKEDDALWARFRAAQDAFFSARDAASAQTDAEFRGNLEVKERLLEEAERLVPVKDLNAAKAALRSIQDRWDAAGKVPRADLQRVEGRLRAVETAIRDADQAAWTRGNPETRARAQGAAAQLEAAIVGLEADLEAARAAGDARRIADAQSALDARRAWLEQVRRAAQGH